VSWAQNEDEVREAQALRFEVFVVEMGAKLTSPRWGFDIDHFDEFCEHLLVRDAHTQRVVGTYRVLTPAQAKRAGGLYTETEFDLSRLDLPRERVLELGRSCVQAQYRNGAAILALWGALAEFMGRNQLDIMIGCASIPLGHMYSVDARWALQRAAALFASIDAEHLLPTPLPAVPRNGLGLDGTSAKAQKTGGAELPALIKAYLRLGARVMGPPAWDTSFNCADLPLILNAHDLRGRHKRAFEQARIQG
jgi:putative hemolysin